MIVPELSRRVLAAALVIAALIAGPLKAQVVVPAGPAAAPAPPAEPMANAPVVAFPTLPPGLQIVRFRAPAGTRVEVLSPNPEPVALPAEKTRDTYGLKVGVAYRLRLSNLPDRPGAELYPVLQVLGHLHPPATVDPSRFPLQVAFGLNDLEDVVDHGRLVTQVFYLEDPDQALPIALPKTEIPIVTLSPAEDPLKVAAALGRVMAVVRLGGRKPSVEELTSERGPDFALDGGWNAVRCPFTGPSGGGCPVPCGPVRGTPPPPGRPWIPRDEFLCDGGDHLEPAHFGGDGGLAGIDPRDALIRFNDTTRPRILPTNLVCIYAPRFAEVRVSVGPNETLKVEAPWRAQVVERQAAVDILAHPKRLVQNQGAELDRGRVRASGLGGRVYAGENSELRVLSGFDNLAHLAGHVRVQGQETKQNRVKPGNVKERIRVEGIKTGEGTKLTGIIQGAGESVMTWTPRETVGVEVPPNRPGLAVIKRVSASDAEPGETITFTIQFRNMGNTPILAVSVIDSLLPRFAYVAGSALGPKGTIFTAAENRAGSTELRWDLPGAIAPGAEGYVSFEVMVR